MAKKRKSITTSLDEVDRTLYASFCTAANSLSQLYTHTMNHQKLSFNAGERHAMENLYQWIWRQQEGGSRVATVDVLNYIQNELDYCEDPSMSPRAPLQHHQSQPTLHIPVSGFPVTSASSGQTIAAHGLRAEPGENQPKNSVFSNALSSPIRRSLQHYQIGEGGCYSNGPFMGSGNRNTEHGFLLQQGRESTIVNSNDSAMDMHPD
ncbi:uncharacterized protein LOC114182531 [Vigna unguiculata]|uniref:uncharacterized protein LOC114182531 n=1 Tax=Vigna unguiculata TaxID=3917 RepID=UPI0010171EFE|nr:uncharacterized protein LOC114182531 [Vigna unguiculata]